VAARLVAWLRGWLRGCAAGARAYVRLVIVRLPVADLGGHVVGRAAGGLGELARVGQHARDPKVAQLDDPPVRGQEDVLRFDVAVEHLAVVDVLDREARLRRGCARGCARVRGHTCERFKCVRWRGAAASSALAPRANAPRAASLAPAALVTRLHKEVEDALLLEVGAALVL
jgi:hypothetical protein